VSAPARPRFRRKAALTFSIGASIILAVLVVTQILVRIGAGTVAADNRPALLTAPIVNGVAGYHWMSPQIAWMNLSVAGPPGSTSADGLPAQRVDTVVARTVDGGRTWHRELYLTGLVWRWYEQFLSPTDAVVVGQRETNASLSTVVWRTTDGGAHWSTSTFEIGPAEMQAVGLGTWIVSATDFLDSRNGWVLFTALYMCAGCMNFVNYSLLYQTSDGGAHWNKMAKVPLAFGLGQSIRFATPKFGVVSSKGSPIWVTRDGGRSGMVIQRPLPQPPQPLTSEVIAEPPTLFSPSDAAFGVDVADVVKVPCVDMSGHNEPLPENVPPYCQSGNTIPVATARYVFASKDGGMDWSHTGPVPVGGPLSYDDAQPKVDFVAPDLWVVTDSNGLAKSVDHGATWSAAARIPIQRGWYVSSSQFLDASHGWVTLSDNAEGSYVTRRKAELFPYPWPRFMMLATTDGGTTWHSISLPMA
jgi:photosystem II stability/assembly factor-like uncharacterized protein